MTSKFLILILLAILEVASFAVVASPALAESTVKLSVTVEAKKSTDTINDFDFSTVNIIYPVQNQIR